MSTVGQLAVLVRLASISARRFRCFIAFCSVSVSYALILKGIPRNTNAYGYVWAGTEPLLSVLIWLAAREAYTLMTERYPLLGRMGTRVFIGASVIAVILSVLLVSLETGSIQRVGPVLHTAFVVRRVFTLAAALFCGVAAAGFALIRIPGKPNVRTHFVLFVVYSLTLACSQLAINIWGASVIGTADTIRLTVVLLLYLGWLVLMHRAGEMPPPEPTSKEADQAERDAAEIMQAIRWRPERQTEERSLRR